jgi:hypothetical protein
MSRGYTKGLNASSTTELARTAPASGALIVSSLFASNLALKKSSNRADDAHNQ